LFLKKKKWDTAGQERFRTLTNAYYQGSEAIVMVYDLCNQKTYDDIETFWLGEVEKFAEKGVTL
jgi:GTPase SAR1 family protein